MHIVLDSQRCTGHGRCYSLAPHVFDADDEGHSVLLLEEVPDEYLGERTLAYVILRADAEPLKSMAIKKFVREKGLAAYKVPDLVEFVTAFPQTGIGKISKKEAEGSPLATAFDQFDTNKDGKLDAKELAAALKSLQEQGGMGGMGQPGFGGGRRGGFGGGGPGGFGGGRGGFGKGGKGKSEKKEDKKDEKKEEKKDEK